MESVIQIYVDKLAQANHNCVLLEARVRELESRIEELEKLKVNDVGELKEIEEVKKEDIDNVQDK